MAKKKVTLTKDGFVVHASAESKAKKVKKIIQEVEAQGRCAFIRDNGKRCKLESSSNSIFCERHNKTLIHDSTRKPVPFDLYDEVIKEFKLIKNGINFSLDEYPHIVPIFHDKHPDIVIIKSAQCGVTEYAGIRALISSKKINGLSIIYTFPSKDLASIFSKRRIDLLKRENPQLFKVYDKNGKIRQHYDSIYERHIGDSYLALAGAWAEQQAISIPADFLIHDEVDFSKDDVVSLFRSRLGNSDWKWRLMFSTPTYPEQGIHKHFLESDQHHWWYICEHCGHEFKLCCSFPEVIHKNEAEQYYFGCPSCHKEINRKKGFYKPDNYGALRRGYHISKISAPRVSANEIMEDKEHYAMEKDFYNFTLGMPYVGLEDKLTRGQLEACEDGRYHLSWKDKGVVLGVDQGGNDLHIVGLKILENKCLQVVYVDRYVGERCWHDLEILMNQLGVVRCVVDGMPDGHKAREFQKKYKGIVYLNFYQQFRKAEGIVWNADKAIVNSDRTMTLDDLTNKIRDKKIVLPITSKQEMERFKLHLLSLTRQKVVKDGSTSFAYKSVREDHYAHALNYALIAGSKLQPSFFKVKYFNNKEVVKEGRYIEQVIDVFAKLVFFEKLAIEDIIQYRCDRSNGKLVENMDFSKNKRIIFYKMEQKFTVENMLATVANVTAIEARMQFVDEEILEL